MCYFCHAQLFEITRVANIKINLVQHSCRNAEVVEAFCRVAASRSIPVDQFTSRLLLHFTHLPRCRQAAPPLDPHSARCLAGAQLPATSCLGAFRTPATAARGQPRHAGIRKPSHHRTHAPQQTALFDHLVRPDEQGGRHCEAERFGSFHVDHQLEFGRLLYRQIGRLGASENSIDVVA